MNIRGSNTLFKDIFELPQPEKSRKGRSETLYSQRNECLLDRYFYYGYTTGNRFDIIIKTLSSEFWLSEITIPELIEKNYDKLTQVKKEYRELDPLSLKIQLQQKWPHLVWH